MNRMLILHCGPMKTGSTAIQDLLEINKKKLLSLGISYHHIRAKGLLGNLENAILEESCCENKIIILHEFFCQSDPILLKNPCSPLMVFIMQSWCQDHCVKFIQAYIFRI